MRQLIVAIISVFVVHPLVMAKELFLCLPQEPNWQTVWKDKVHSIGKGAAAIVDVSTSEIIWVGKDGIYSLTGDLIDNGVHISMVNGRRTSQPIVEANYGEAVWKFTLATGEANSEESFTIDFVYNDGKIHGAWEKGGQRVDFSYCTPQTVL